MVSVSVILPTYNRAHSISLAIQSVLNQTYLDFELIIVDDGSTDNTAQIIQQILDPRIRYNVHDINKGAAAARNTGMRLAKGKYIAFLDSDDSWVPDKLEKQLTFLKTQPNVVSGCVSYYRLQFPEKSIIRKISMEDSFYQQSLKGCNLSPGSTLVFKKDCLKQAGYQDETLKRFEDWEWQIRFAKFYQWKMVPEVLADIKTGHSVRFEVAKQALIRLEELTELLPRSDKKIIKMAIYYELFYAAFKNRLWGWVFYSISCSFIRNPYKFILFVGSHLRRKLIEIF